MAVPYEAERSEAKYGGERGIRTLDAPLETYMISSHALSTTQPSLHLFRYFFCCSSFFLVSFFFF